MNCARSTARKIRKCLASLVHQTCISLQDSSLLWHCMDVQLLHLNKVRHYWHCTSSGWCDNALCSSRQEKDRLDSPQLSFFVIFSKLRTDACANTT